MRKNNHYYSTTIIHIPLETMKAQYTESTHIKKNACKDQRPKYCMGLYIRQ